MHTLASTSNMFPATKKASSHLFKKPRSDSELKCSRLIKVNTHFFAETLHYEST